MNFCKSRRRDCGAPSHVLGPGYKPLARSLSYSTPGFLYAAIQAVFTLYHCIRTVTMESVTKLSWTLDSLSSILESRVMPHPRGKGTCHAKKGFMQKSVCAPQKPNLPECHFEKLSSMLLLLHHDIHSTSQLYHHRERYP